MRQMSNPWYQRDGGAAWLKIGRVFPKCSPVSRTGSTRPQEAANS